MANLTQLGSDLFLGSTYAVVIHKDESNQVWVAHHTDKTRQYRTDWTAQQVAEAITATRTEQNQIDTARSNGIAAGKRQAVADHNRRPWWKRMQKIE